MIRYLYRIGFLAFLLHPACATPPEGGASTLETDRSTTNPYTEPHRPQLHFSPRANWMNDPNGLVYLDGEYHLFYQYHPDSTIWGPMHWGHAVSPDLLQWEELPIALYPDSLGYIFSGSAVVDHRNTSGLGDGLTPPLVAIFTHHDPVGEAAGQNDFQYQSLAYSQDRGRSWTKYPANPVLPNAEGIRDFRDPKVIWDERREQWVLVLAARDRVKFYTSPNLIDWTYRSDFGAAYGEHGGVWECPDIFPLPVGGGGGEKWVLLLSINAGAPNGGSGTQYFIGDFDGATFTLDPDFRDEVAGTKGIWLDYGRDNYAGVTFSDIPEADGRRLFLGWMSNWTYAQVVPTTPWRSAMTLPRSLSLRPTPAGLRVVSAPVREISSLRAGIRPLSPTDTVLPGLSAAPAAGNGRIIGEIDVRFLVAADTEEGEFGIELANAAGERYRVGYDVTRDAYYSDRREAGPAVFSDEFADRRSLAPRPVAGDTVRMHLVLDVASMELFADGGATVMTEIFFPSAPFTQVRVYGLQSGVRFLGGTASPLRSIWKK